MDQPSNVGRWNSGWRLRVMQGLNKRSLERDTAKGDSPVGSPVWLDGCSHCLQESSGLRLQFERGSWIRPKVAY